MTKKRRPKPLRSTSETNSPPPVARSVFNSPFKDLKRLLSDSLLDSAANKKVDNLPAKSIAGVLPDGKPRPSPLSGDSIPGPDDAAMFEQAIDGVRRLWVAGPARISVEPATNRAIVSEDAEVLAQLSDLVSGQAPFDITETEEYVEGARVGVDPRLVTQLRRGEFSSQAHIDLHGMVQTDAKEALRAFIIDSTRKGLRSITVVHGRGLGSPGGRPILKHATVKWLSHGYLSGFVLAFTTARPADGGAGALYVLLKRERRRAPFAVLSGTKRHD
jgi:DNA-nicking Smr family endonuclease